ncbi:kinase-like domain-containing protein [Rhizophagus irregularis DAOM 181602=DAOM 197198]|uniref:Kinase-like domain-containing protein n=1 Tax=Rhizophagus irregularis (strain DAOM 181602 / DAOM 197198 / MUCL 43194) TaxID=747089 RepID=A0A2P4PUC1_RHIID|nr:kinase-like domain-containing protein [Rhizophagus irregularis DAOM 181602=DAOM 197198]POG68993.1 kinase-like domain-containing protein [Rhizophagus irregularis DAOM 181602=DAOM 197198]|eukprot:XP_025175859.1 kinase-like domain-containing protein [Rhizophagus irregularis DAOM 181602=DAOM 197198]
MDKKLKISSNNKKCSYCNKPITKKSWCKECDPFRMIEGWTSGNFGIDKFIKDTIYDARNYSGIVYKFLVWVPFNRFTNLKKICEGGFAEVYTAIWIDGRSEYHKNNGTWRKVNPEPGMKVALKILKGSNNMSDEYLNELRIHWNISREHGLSLYGITKDPKTEEFVMILEFACEGNLRSSLSKNFNNTLWKNKIKLLHDSLIDLQKLHKSGYFHKDIHSGNILRIYDDLTYISDFGLSGPANEQKLNDKVYGVMPFVAPEVLNGKPYTSSADIYSLGVVMVEVSSGKPPFYNIKHDVHLALDICGGLRPEFGKGTPEFYKELAYKCMNADSNKRPTADELCGIFKFWYSSINGNTKEVEVFGYKGKEIKEAFEEADKEIPNISISYEKNSDAVYTSRALPKPVNKDYDSKLPDLEIPNSMQLRDIDNENTVDN